MSSVGNGSASVTVGWRFQYTVKPIEVEYWWTMISHQKTQVWKPCIWTVDKDINMKVIFNLLQICEVGGLLAQLVEHCTSIAEVTGQFKSCFHSHIFFSSSNIWLSFIHSRLFTTYGFIWNQHDNQLPVGLLAQLVEHCTGIAEVLDSNPIQAWIFFRPYFHHC